MVDKVDSIYKYGTPICRILQTAGVLGSFYGFLPDEQILLADGLFNTIVNTVPLAGLGFVSSIFVPHVLLNHVIIPYVRDNDLEGKIENSLFDSVTFPQELGVLKRRFINHKFVYTLFLKGDCAAQKYLESLIDSYPTYYFPFVALGDHYMSEGDFELGFRHLRRGVQNYFEYPFFTQYEIGRARDNAMAHLKLRDNDPEHSTYNHIVYVLYSLLGHDFDKVFLDSKFVETQSDNLWFQIQYASILESALQRAKFIQPEWLKMRDSQWEKCIELLLERDSDFVRLGESQNKVFCVEDEFVIKQNTRREPLVSESELPSRIKKILITRRREIDSEFFLDVVQPRYVSMEPIDGNYFYAMRYDPGETLMQLIDKGDSRVPEIIKNVVRYMALLHANLPSGTKVDLKSKTEDRLATLKDEIPDSVRRLFGEHLVSCYEALGDINFVVNDDGHPENWIVGQIGKRITRIDLEDRGSVQQAIALVNLFGYSDSENLRGCLDQGLQEYISSFERFSCRRINGDFRLQYLNGVIPRILSLFAAWSNPTRPTMRDKRIGLILNAQRSLRTIKKEYPDIYKSRSHNYNGLEKAIEETLRVLKT